MSELGDRLILLLFVVTGAGTLLTWLVAGEVIHLPEGVTGYVLPVAFLAALIGVAVVAWEWFDVID